MGLLALVTSFVVLWIGLAFIFLSLNAFLIFTLRTEKQFYAGMISLFCGLFLIVGGACYIIKELR